MGMIALQLFTLLSPVKAQQGMKPFEHLGVGLEVGTVGFGLDVAVPVHSFIVVRGGFNILPFSYSDDYHVNHERNEINSLIRGSEELYNALKAANLPTDAGELSYDIDLDGKLDMLNGKIVADIYPFKKSSFHVIAGLYFGKSKIINLDGHVDPTTMRFLNTVNEVSGEDFGSSISVEDYTITADRNGNINAALKVNGVKPYVGIGFGNSIPKKTCRIPF